MLLGAASTRWRSFGQQLYGSPDWQARRKRFEERARDSLGGPTFDAGFRHGSTMNASDMLAYALDNASAPLLPDPQDMLTEREREIVAFVADGLTNRQIAEQLVLSHRTIEGHISRTLAKLGLRRRAQLAAWMARRRSARA
ncbi:MAG: helix-turn-helix transcriptional regulator [Pseudonocardia sp.]|nr:helix-turn-helix transcriptional regulator [Pseudonocardia sp.]